MINKLSLFAQQVDHLDSVYMYIFRSTLFIYTIHRYKRCILFQVFRSKSYEKRSFNKCVELSSHHNLSDHTCI